MPSLLQQYYSLLIVLFGSLRLKALTVMLIYVSHIIHIGLSGVPEGLYRVNFVCLPIQRTCDERHAKTSTVSRAAFFNDHWSAIYHLWHIRPSDVRLYVRLSLLEVIVTASFEN